MITHGMFSSAATRRYVETVVAMGVPDRVFKWVMFFDAPDSRSWTYVYSYNVNFVGMVLPGDELDVGIKHTAMHDGNFVVGVAAVNQRGEKVLEGTVEVAQPPTVYAVWDSADAHLISAYGFSIVEIVWENPKKKGTF